MTVMSVKNRRSKISPGGVLTLPVSARKALGMEKGKGSRVTVALESDGVALRRCSERAGSRVSAKGQLELVGQPRALLERGAARHFWLEVDDERQMVVLHPYTDGE